MYKKILIVASIVAGLTSCNGDYTDWVMPQTNAQQDAKTTKLVATGVKDLIDLETVTTDSVQVMTFSEMPTVSSFEATCTFTNIENSKTYSIPVDMQGRVSVKDLKNVIANLYGRTRQEVTLGGHISAVATTVPTAVQSTTTIRLNGESSIYFKAEYPDQPSYYFFAGNANQWATEASVPFIPTADEKTIQTLTTYFWSAWDLKFWFKDDIGSWDKCFGTSVDGAKDASGSLINSNAQSFASPEEGFYTLTIDMKNNTYSWTKCEEQFPAEYNQISIIGWDGDWNNDIDMVQAVANKDHDNMVSHIWHAYNVVAKNTTAAKFRVDHDWATSWGNSSELPYGTASAGGNIEGIDAGTYDIYFNDITKQYLFLAK